MMADQSGYPARNPFPYLGTLRLAGQRLEDGLPVVANFRTLDREPVEKLIKRSEAFMKRFEAKWSNQGEVVVIRGPHGSGKTHTIFAAWRTLVKPAYPIYVLQQNADFISLYAQIMQRLTPELLKQMSCSLLGVITAEQLASQQGNSAQPEELEAKLQGNPDLVTALFSSYKVEEGVAIARQEKALLELTQGDRNLQRAVYCLQSDQFDAEAAAWFRAEPVAKERLEAMGISSEIQTPEQVVAALQMIAALFAVSKIPLVLFIDQSERLILDEDPATAMANIGYLRSLLEAFVSRNAMLVISGNEEAWRRLHEDLKSRVSLNVVDCPLLRLDEAIDIVRLYVTPAGVPFQAGIGSLYPFTESAVRTMLTLGAGNPRRLLQFCYNAFEQAASARAIIDDYLITSMARSEFARQYFDRARVDEETRRLLAREPFRIEECFSINGMAFDYALMSSSGDPLLLLDVKDAIFAHEEAGNALISADIATRLREMGLTAYYVVVVKGYVSPEIIDNLQKVVHELIVFTPETFEAQLNNVLARIRERAAGIVRENETSEKSIQDIRKLLLDIKQERSKETDVLTAREEDVSLAHRKRRYEERLEKARYDWKNQRRKLETDIAQARRDRINKSLGEVNDQIHRSVRNRYIRSGVVTAIFFLFVTTTLDKGFFGVSLYESQQVYFVLLSSVFYYLAFEWVPVWIRPNWTQPIKSLWQLEQLIAKDLERPGLSFFFHSPLMYHHSPFGRTIRALKFSKNNPQIFKSMVASEPLGALRQICCRLASKNNIDLSLFMDSREIRQLPELSILLEKNYDMGMLEYRMSEMLDKPFDLIYVLCRKDVYVHKPRLTWQLCAISSENHMSEDSLLAQAFREGLDRVNLRQLTYLSERELRDAIRELTPFEDGGLGTYDFLEKIQQIDQLFLFCSQLLFYYEMDLL